MRLTNAFKGSVQKLKAFASQHKMLMLELGNLDVTEITLTILKEYLEKANSKSHVSHSVKGRIT